ncbi:MAG: YigZ family protein [Anaerolineaceae bacterium]|nr:MAG: YigZ family protein [Anaerolineaceae bacterium]
MMDPYNTIYRGGIGEFIMKKSRFIATVSPAETEEEALSFIESLKKKYWNASHNCYAYIIGTNNPTMRYSDDGEPSQTAGKPMLDVLIAKELTNLVIVVTRYFGGTLLGTGGLVKAYQSATLEGLNNSTIIKKEPGIHIQVITDYNLIGKIQYYIGQEGFPIISSDYTDIVTLDLLIPLDKIDGFNNRLADLSNGSLLPTEIKKVYFAVIDSKVHLF